MSHSPYGKESIHGLGCAGSAFLIWGLSPFYWKALHGVPAVELLMHRVLWSALFLVPFVLLAKRTGEFLDALRNPRLLVILFFTTLFVALNWVIFIWAINNGFLLQTSLGYYINPLLSVLLGMIFLRERLRRAQAIAVVLAALSVTYLTFGLGRFPWIALSLAFSFGLYGLIRKIAPVSAVVGLFIETLMLTPPALGYLLYLHSRGTGAFSLSNPGIDLLIMASALVTGLPLLLFTLGAKRLHLATVGFLQYIVPSCFFLFAVFVFHEPITAAQVFSFVLIWSALAIYTTDSILIHKKSLHRG